MVITLNANLAICKSNCAKSISKSLKIFTHLNIALQRDGKHAASNKFDGLLGMKQENSQGRFVFDAGIEPVRLGQ